MSDQEQWDAEIAKLIAWGFTEKVEYPDLDPMNDDDRVFYHKSNTRQNIAVMLCEGQHNDIDFIVYIRRNIGCEYVMMPFNWGNLDYKWLNALKLSLDGAGLKGEKLYE